MKDEPAEAAPKPIPSVARDASYLTRSAGVKTGRTQIELPLFTQLRTFGGATLPAANLAASRIFSTSLPIGTTATPQKIMSFCRTMNVAPLFDRFGGRRMVGAFWFLPILRIGPVPTRATPGLNGQSSMRRVAPQLAHECQLPQHHAS
jgi:hypothetical protein